MYAASMANARTITTWRRFGGSVVCFGPLIAESCQPRISRRHRRGHGPFRGRAPHDDVRVGCLNVCNDVPVDVSRNNEVTTTAVPAGTSRVPRWAPVSRFMREAPTPSFRSPIRSWCRRPRCSGGARPSCARRPPWPSSSRSAWRDECPMLSASTISWFDASGRWLPRRDMFSAGDLPNARHGR